MGQTREPAFRVLAGDFVTTEDGTGIVHIAPTFGADDYKVALQNKIPPLMVVEKSGISAPLWIKKEGLFQSTTWKKYLLKNLLM